jgi:hypothetical protein
MEKSFKVGDREIEIRVSHPVEKLESMTAHSGDCSHCQGIVKMERDRQTFKLRPDRCRCFLCGQGYYMEIADIDAWERLQWKQKADQERAA